MSGDENNLQNMETPAVHVDPPTVETPAIPANSTGDYYQHFLPAYCKIYM